MRPFSIEGLVMLDWISPQLPWWVTGPGVGLCVVALYGLCAYASRENLAA